ncbi:methyl-accepting chemotaxis protein [Pseudobacillus sp. FSL P4-0506]|uniref:methyl-accepting chemotaxis protein n=1 Tax=Pseudobacillus sp. FSL P4-0506 TaxID=2921576 RepID=UPI0030F7939B
MRKNASVRSKILLVITAIIFTIGLAASAGIYYSVHTSANHSLGAFAGDIAKNYSETIDGEKYESFINDPKEDRNYHSLQKKLAHFREQTGALFVYILDVDGQKVRNMIDGGSNLSDDKPPAMGDESSIPAEELAPVLEGEIQRTDVFNDPKYGQYLSGFAPIKNENGEVIGVLGIDISAETANKIGGDVFFSTGLKLLALIFLLFLLTVGGMNVYLKRKLSPLTLLEKQAEKMGNGDFSEQIQAASGKDEFSKIQQAFILMQKQLRGLIKEVQSSSDYSANTFTEITNGSRDIREQTKEIVHASSEIALGNQEVTKAVEKSAVAVNHLHENLNDMEQNIQKLHRFFKEITAGQQESIAQLSQFIIHSEQTQTSYQSMVEELKILQEESAAITKIISDIQGIADHTNLLALNASIEAARAGEHGKGFAVVAKEVSALSTQSKEATSMIQHSLSNIQSQVEKTIERTDATSREFLIQKAEIDAVITNVNRLKEKIEQSFRELTVIQERTSSIMSEHSTLNHQMISVNSVSEETAAATEEVDAIIQQVQSNLNRFTDQVIEAGHVVTEVHQKVRAFKL